MFADGRRLHLQHGPIDLIVEAGGESGEAGAAYDQARARFDTVLAELVEELPALRRAAAAGDGSLAGTTARRMQTAVLPHATESFVTPMAAVAGAVADEVLAAMTSGRSLDRAYVNNGGDIAFHLGSGASFNVGLVQRPDRPELGGMVRLARDDGIGGVATSGRHGRSLSLGIADAVTVLARDAAAADAAATLIANAVDTGPHPAVQRVAANSLDPDSDLGERLVVVEVGPLSEADVTSALDRGALVAESMRQRGLIAGAALFLQGGLRLIGAAAPKSRQVQRQGAPHARG